MEGIFGIYNVGSFPSKVDFVLQAKSSFIPSFIRNHCFYLQASSIYSRASNSDLYFNMKTTSLVISLLAGIATASPLSVEIRQSTNVGTTANEYTRGGCKDIIFFFARGSTEVGNMVSVATF